MNTLKCKHDKNFSIVELGDASTSHSYEYGIITHYSDVHDYTGSIYFRCAACGYERMYNRYGKRFPLWVDKLYLKVKEEDCSYE